MKKIICLWSCPRNISTALMYSFSSRNDTAVFDEPLYGHYLIKSNVNHPGRNQIIKSVECDAKQVIKETILKPKKNINFHKLMTHFLIDLDLDFLKKVTNILFIRDPREIINSYHKVIPHPNIDDIGVEKQYLLYNHLKNSNIDFVILDAKDLLTNPKKTLQALCKKINIPFDENMLKWKKGPKKEDGIWAKYWYKNVHQSTEFKKYKKQKITLDSKNLRLEKKCLQYYKILKQNSLKMDW